jgi:hypothetical protein
MDAHGIPTLVFTAMTKVLFVFPGIYIVIEG